MTEAAVSRLHFPITTLGPGRRVGLWFQGCSIRCPGCISVDTWEPGLGVVDLADLLARISELAKNADGLTVSGGEPFDQPAALAAVLRHWRRLTPGLVIVFTGRELEEVSSWLATNPDLIDALITGPFRSELPQISALRGSDNQTIHVLTPAGNDMREFDRPRHAGDRKLDVMFDEAGLAWFAGIPGRGDLGRLRRVLASAGHTVTTSDAIGFHPQ
nr:4Fe-4S single cluster domain-containing protein [uncultured Sphingomonas sp.]